MMDTEDAARAESAVIFRGRAETGRGADGRRHVDGEACIDRQAIRRASRFSPVDMTGDLPIATVAACRTGVSGERVAEDVQDDVAVKRGVVRAVPIPCRCFSLLSPEPALPMHGRGPALGKGRPRLTDRERRPGDRAVVERSRDHHHSISMPRRANRGRMIRLGRCQTPTPSALPTELSTESPLSRGRNRGPNAHVCESGAPDRRTRRPQPEPGWRPCALCLANSHFMLPE